MQLQVAAAREQAAPMDETVLEILADFANALEAAAITLKQRVAEIASAGKATTANEEAFAVLTFEKRTGDRLGEYEISLKSANQDAKWNQAYKILEANNASINDRYHPEGYIYCYWLYDRDKIYRQRLRQA